MLAPSSFPPQAFLDSAQEWLRTPAPDEALLRSAVSRAYYAVWLTARDQLFGADGRKLTFAKGQVRSQARANQLKAKHDSWTIHETVISAVVMKAARPMDGKVLGDRLSQLKDMRIVADYCLTGARQKPAFEKYGVGTWSEFAQLALELASQVIPDVRRLPQW